MKLLSITEREFSLFVEMLKEEEPSEAFNLKGVSIVDKLAIYNAIKK